MSESARQEALRLAREAGFDLHWPSEPEVGLFEDGWVANGDQIIKLIALARQRPSVDAQRYRWLAYIGDSSWTPLCRRDNGPGGVLFEQYIDAAYARYSNALAAALKPEEGT
jgi:hypothetical protein